MDNLNLLLGGEVFDAVVIKAGPLFEELDGERVQSKDLTLKVDSATIALERYTISGKAYRTITITEVPTETELST